MAIDSYAELQSEILDTLNREDLVADVSDYTPGTIEGAVKRAIAKAENRLARRIRTRQLESSTAISTVASTETITLPTDWLGAKLLQLRKDPKVNLAPRDLQQLYEDFPSQTPGQPAGYAVFGTQARLRPIPDSVMTVDVFYYAKPTPMSAAADNNVWLQNYPDLLLYGALLELTAHLKEDERIQVWKGYFDEGIKDVTEDNVMSRWTGAPIRQTIDVRSV